MSTIDDLCWMKYSSLLENTIDWFRKHGRFYRSSPWREEFLYKYSHGLGLDLGCGLASTTRELLRSGYLKELFLLDIVEETLLQICSFSSELICIKSDVLIPPFRENMFDTVYLLSVLHHIPGEECRLHILREIYRVLKPANHAIITTWSPDLGKLLRKSRYLNIDDKSYVLIDRYGRRYYYFYEIDELINQIKSIGFKVVEHGIFIQNLARPDIARNIYVVVSKK